MSYQTTFYLIPRANVYRRDNDIPYSWGTAVNVQSMAFGNTGDDCGTGVAFTRNPATGEKKLFGEFQMCIRDREGGAACSADPSAPGASPDDTNEAALPIGGHRESDQDVGLGHVVPLGRPFAERVFHGETVGIGQERLPIIEFKRPPERNICQVKAFSPMPSSRTSTIPHTTRPRIMAEIKAM